MSLWSKITVNFCSNTEIDIVKLNLSDLWRLSIGNFLKSIIVLKMTNLRKL